MNRSMSSDSSQLGHMEDDPPRKKPRYSPSIKNKPESDRWEVVCKLGQRSYGSVYLARTPDGSDLPYDLAIKSKELSKASTLHNEIEILDILNSPFVVKHYGDEVSERDDKVIYSTLLEYCYGGCLAKYVKKLGLGLGLPEEHVKGIAEDILFGLKYIHGKKVIHGDIKPKNILRTLIRNPTTAAYKISGFGKAMKKGSVKYGDGWGHRRGTTRFMSPELMGDTVLDYGADVWAFGCTVLEILTGKRVWSEHGELDWEDWIDLIGNSGCVPCIPHWLSEKGKDFLRKCLERDPVKRWSVDRLLRHEFLMKEVQPEQEEEEEEGEAYLEEEEEEIVVPQNQDAYEEDLEEILPEEEEEEEIVVLQNQYEEELEEEEEEEEAYLQDEQVEIEIDEEYYNL